MPSTDRPAGPPLGGRVQRGARMAKFSASTGAGYVASRVRGLGSSDAEERFHAETAEKIVELLGSMKGAAMKLGQIASFVDLDLPEEVQAQYQQVLAELRSSAPPHDPSEILQAITDEYGAPPDSVFASWDPEPIAAASIGQVHRATLPDGTLVVTKVQYPGVAEAVQADLANAEAFAPLAKLVARNLQVRPLMEELRARLGDELDYQREAQYQQAFCERYDGHPFIRVPRVHADWCRPRVLVTDYVEGATFDQVVAERSAEEKRRYGEIIYRFVFGSLNRFRLFNADPHPGNYLFCGDGSVAFLDFGSVKAFSTATRVQIQGQLDAVLAGDAEGLLAMLVEAKFLPQGTDVDPVRVLEWFQTFNEPLLADAEYEYTADFARRAMRLTGEPFGPWGDVVRRLNLPPDYLLLNRIQFGVNSVLSQLGARGNWRAIADEFRGGAPATALGEQEAPFIDSSPYRT